MIRKILIFFRPNELRRSFLLLLLVIIMAFIDTVGIASIMPFIAILGNQDIIQSNQTLNWIYQFLGFKNNIDFLTFAGSVVFFTLVTSISFKAFTTKVLFKFTHMMEFSLATRLAAGYFKNPYEWFLGRNSSEMGKNILSELQKVLNNIFLPFMQLIAHGSIVLSIMILLVIVEPRLAIMSCLFLGFSYWIVYSILKSRLKFMGEEQIKANTDRFSILSEGFGGIKDVKVGSLESVFINRFSIAAKLNAEIAAKVQIYAHIPKFIIEVIVFGGMIVLLLYKINITGSFVASLPTVALFAVAGYRLMPSLQQIYHSYTVLRFSSPLLDLIGSEIKQLEIINKQINTQEEPVQQIIFNKSIEFDNVSYMYPNQSQFALKNINLLVNPGSSVAFVGETGSGKTTALDVLLGVLYPQKGYVRIDGIPINSNNHSYWGVNVGYVSQSIFLCDDSIEANIAFGVEPDEVDISAVTRAAKIAQLHEFIINELPEGYKTKVGERGVRLSGGQRQRIGIARALYKTPSVLILDEATSALDNLTEQLLMKAIKEISSKITIIAVAHRLSSVKNFDNIYFFNRGKIVANGTFKYLRQINSQFERMAQIS